MISLLHHVQPVGDSGVFSGPQIINQNESNMYNELITIEKLETNSKQGPLGMKKVENH